MKRIGALVLVLPALALLPWTPGCTGTTRLATRTPTPAPLPTETASYTVSPVPPTRTRTRTSSPSETRTATATMQASATSTASSTDSATPAPSTSASATASETATESPTESASSTPSSSETSTGTSTATATPAPAGTELAAGQGGPFELAVDANYVYWTNDSGMDVRFAPLAGGTPAVLASVGRSARPIASDPTYVYWADYDPTPTSNRIWRVQKSGGSPTPIAAYPDVTNANALETDGTHVFWTDAGNQDVRRVPVAGGTVEALHTPFPTPMGLALDAGYLYVDYAGGTMAKLGLAPGTPVCVTGFCGVPDTAVSADDWFFCEPLPSCGGLLCKVTASGCTNLAILATGVNGARRMASDGLHVYWSEYVNPGRVARVPTNGGALVSLGEGQNLPLGLALDASYVYWCENGAGKVRRAGK